jgi:hypothetical protein
MCFNCCARGERPCRRTINQRNELSLPYSITLSARASSVGGIVVVRF